jgi:hypothetical protein
MPFVKHTPPPGGECRDPGHRPPTMIVLPNGTHVWKCPACGRETTVVANRPTL